MEDGCNLTLNYGAVGLRIVVDAGVGGLQVVLEVFFVEEFVDGIAFAAFSPRHQPGQVDFGNGNSATR
jgi:hypothetical protein